MQPQNTYYNSSKFRKTAKNNILRSHVNINKLETSDASIIDITYPGISHEVSVRPSGVSHYGWCEWNEMKWNEMKKMKSAMI